ncbi:MAG TPA: 30S ribosomal protein S4 [Candidatus Nanoarchaeia archaeon]|nr:30S ribosomal protein S4 [Candidatus Nanoarchaeia archaeon]
MGDPRRLRKKYTGLMHPWRRETIDAEKEVTTEYSLKNKQEVWRMNSFLREFKNQAKKLIALKSVQADKEREALIKRLQQLGLLSLDAKLDSVLSLSLRDVLERRLQSFIFRKGFARTMLQARQFIVHRHVTVAGREITAPSYMIKKAEEESVQFTGSSSLINPEHPERVPIVKKEKKRKKVEVTHYGTR